jgi:hypothetical protein
VYTPGLALVGYPEVGFSGLGEAGIVVGGTTEPRFELPEKGGDDVIGLGFDGITPGDPAAGEG